MLVLTADGVWTPLAWWNSVCLRGNAVVLERQEASDGETLSLELLRCENKPQAKAFYDEIVSTLSLDVPRKMDARAWLGGHKEAPTVEGVREATD